MKRGDRIEVEVAALTAKGDGMAYVGHREVVVRQSVPGDRVAARVVKKRKGRFEAEVEEFLAESYKREEPRCAHFGHCGGCRWQELPYAAQLAVKEQMVASALATSGLVLPPVAPISAQSDSLFLSQQNGVFLWCGSRGLACNWACTYAAFQLDIRVSKSAIYSLTAPTASSVQSAASAKRWV